MPLHDLVGRLGDVDGTLEVNIDERVENLVVDVLEGGVAQVTGVVDDDIDPAEAVQCRLHDAFAAGAGAHGVVVRDGLATGRSDFLDYLVRHALGAAAPIKAAAQVVHDYGGAPGAELQRVGAAQAASGAGDYGNSVLEID
ncbi:hypothetical protein D9M71_462690 [compost metagenome]